MTAVVTTTYILSIVVSVVSVNASVLMKYLLPSKQFKIFQRCVFIFYFSFTLDSFQ